MPKPGMHSGLETDDVLNLAMSEKAQPLFNAVKKFIAEVEKIDEITECYIITGEGDMLIKIVCRDIPAYEQLMFKNLSQIEEIERLKTLVTLSTVKDSKVLPFKYD